jgi:dephospho-CoA kinase
MIIGLTGTISSGKSTVAQILVKKGFEHHTYSDILRREAKKRSIIATRINLQKLGNQIKKESKNFGILSKLIIENSKSEKIIADGIRTVDEIKELKKYPNSHVIAVDAPQIIRFKRLAKRKRTGDPLTFKEFKKIDDHENEGLSKGQEINKCISKADFVINNSEDINKLKKEIDSILTRVKNRQS